MRAVLDLDPFAAAPGAIAAIASLGDNPLEPHDTCLSEDDRAVRIHDVLRQAETVLATIQKLGQQKGDIQNTCLKVFGDFIQKGCPLPDKPPFAPAHLIVAQKSGFSA